VKRKKRAVMSRFIWVVRNRVARPVLVKGTNRVNNGQFLAPRHFEWMEDRFDGCCAPQAPQFGGAQRLQYRLPIVPVPTVHELPCVYVREQSVPFRAGIYRAEPHESLHRLGGNGSGISRSLQIKFGLILIGWIDCYERFTTL
jgi:hypothetical protein